MDICLLRKHQLDFQSIKLLLLKNLVKLNKMLLKIYFL